MSAKVISVEALLEHARSLPVRERKELLARAVFEKRRRRDLGVTCDAEGQWRDTETQKSISEEDIMRREIAHERGRPKPIDFQNKMVVDRQWLLNAVGEEAFEKACHEGDVLSLMSWL